MSVLKWVRIKKTGSLLLAIILATVFYSCNSDKAAFERAQANNTVSGYQEFINSNPKSRFLSDADSLIEILQWKQACSANTKESYASFLKLRPDGIYSSKASDSLKRLIWADTIKAGTVQIVSKNAAVTFGTLLYSHTFSQRKGKGQSSSAFFWVPGFIHVFSDTTGCYHEGVRQGAAYFIKEDSTRKFIKMIDTKIPIENVANSFGVSAKPTAVSTWGKSEDPPVKIIDNGGVLKALGM